MFKQWLFSFSLAFALAGTLVLPRAASAEEQVDVESVKKKYWARGDESELGVVQNRLYTKERKLEFSALGGIISSDPFLDVRNVGASVGYHLDETFAVHLLAWKSFASSSGALDTFERVSGVTTNTNKPRSYVGGELGVSLIYGKLSLLGKKIIYYDLHTLGGLGVNTTETGTYLTPSLGVGQQIWLSHQLAFRIDYRLMPYGEDIVEKVRPSLMGQVVDHRTNWSNVVTLGLSFLLGGGER